MKKKAPGQVFLTWILKKNVSGSILTVHCFVVLCSSG